jgi:hypothetical protein
MGMVEVPPPQLAPIPVTARNPATHNAPAASFLLGKILETFICGSWDWKKRVFFHLQTLDWGTELYLWSLEQDVCQAPVF